MFFCSSFCVFLGDASKRFFYNGRVPFFLILAGYFLGRNITWEKAFNRALWLFIPFMIWNVLYAGLKFFYNGYSYGFMNLFGIGNVFFPDIALFPGNNVHPPISASWFLRDIIILTLLTPLLNRIKPLLIPAVLLFFVYIYKGELSSATLSIDTCAFYSLGVLLSSRKISDIHLILNEKFNLFFWVSIFIPIVLFSLHNFGIISEKLETVIGMLLGVMMIMYAGIWMEKHLPKLSAKIALLAPACFLSFMLHMPIYEILNRILPLSLQSGLFALFIPPLVFTGIVLFYFAMKRFTPFLLPYLAHVKNTERK